MSKFILARAASGDRRLRDLQERMVRFYEKHLPYYRDAAEGDKSFIYEPILHHIKARYASLSRPVRVLELGAGRTSFVDFLNRSSEADIVEYVAHDINDTNVEFYIENGIEFVCGGWPEVRARGQFDLCFSTAVFEHLVEPHRFLQGITEALSPGGDAIIFCPKYGVPGYVPPAIRWLPWIDQQLVTLFLFFSNLWVRATGIPNFWICVEPAVFKKPWRRDFDAVHMVSFADLKAALKKQFELRRFPLHRSSVRMRLLHRIIHLSVIIRKRGSHD
jgi:SAM-dependent methyltransferase